MKETDKDSKILTKPICYLICIFLILNIIFVTRFAFIYDVCYIPNEYKYLTGLTSEQMPLFALINRWALNPKFSLAYDVCYISKEDKSLTGLNNEQTPLFALIYRWSLNPHSFDIYYFDSPFILMDTYVIGNEGSSSSVLYGSIYHNTQLNYVIWGYDILCIILYIKLRKHMKSL